MPARYLLRLGMGEAELETELDFSRTGRVNAMLARRLELLAEVRAGGWWAAQSTGAGRRPRAAGCGRRQARVRQPAGAALASVTPTPAHMPARPHACSPTHPLTSCPRWSAWPSC